MKYLVFKGDEIILSTEDKELAEKKFKETECSCEICQNMCKTPCIGTPLEMGKKKIINEDKSS